MNFMKYQVILYRHETINQSVYASTRDEALSRALAAKPGFRADCVMELLDEDETGDVHEVSGGCESCGKTLWHDDGNCVDEEGTCFASPAFRR